MEIEKKLRQPKKSMIASKMRRKTGCVLNNTRQVGKQSHCLDSKYRSIWLILMKKAYNI